MAIRNLHRRYTFEDLDLHCYTLWVGKTAEWSHGYVVSFYFGVNTRKSLHIFKLRDGLVALRAVTNIFHSTES